MYTCIWRVRMWTCLKHCFNIFATHGGLFLNQFCEVQSKRVPNTWREKCCRLELLWTFGRTAKPCLGVQLYLAIFIYVYNIYINNYIHIYNIYIYAISDCRGYTYPNLWRFKSDGYTNFSSWTAPPSAESVFDSPKVIQGHPVASTTGCLFQFTQTFPYVAWRFIIHFYGHSHHEKMGVSQIIGLASQPSRSWSAWWRNFTILKNMSSSMGRIVIPYMGK